MTKLCKCGMEWDDENEKTAHVVKHVDDCPECRGETLPEREPEEE